MNSSSKRLTPFLWIYLIAGVTVAILFYGFRATDNRQNKSHEIDQAEQADQTLATLAFGSRIQPYLTRIARDLKNTLQKSVCNQQTNPDPHRPFFSKNFPETELWVFKNSDSNNFQANFYPAVTKTGRRAMINLFSALHQHDYSISKDKLADFLFGPGLKISTLLKQKGRPIRIIYQNRHHFLIWDSLDLQGKNAGGFFLLVPEGVELSMFSMRRTAERMSSLKATTARYAGYLNLFSPDTDVISDMEIFNQPELLERLKLLQIQNSQNRLETGNLPFNEEQKNWKLYTRAIPQSPYLAFMFVNNDQTLLKKITISGLVAALYVGAGILLLLVSAKGFQLPALSLKLRFFLLFSALASIPFSLLLISAQVYLEELRITLLRESRQQLQNSISFFDKNVQDSYLIYQNEFKKLHQEPWIKQFEQMEQPVNRDLDTRLKTFFNRLAPPLPWGSLVIADEEGRSIVTFSSDHHKSGLEGYMKFNRIGIIEGIRNRHGYPSIETTGKNDYISEEDITLKKSYEAQVKLPIYHAFSNTHAGVTIQIAFGNLSIIRIVDYFPSEKSPIFGISVAWNESDLDREFSLMAIKKWRKEYPSVEFEIFKKDNETLSPFGRTHKRSNFVKTAYSTAMQDRPVYFHDKAAQTIEIGLPSEKRPGIILVGKADIQAIQKRIESIRNHFYLFLFLGMWALLFFRDALFKRLILPLLLLEKTLQTMSHGIMTRLPDTLRRDEINNIFSSFNEMINGVKARNRLLSLVSGSALSTAGQEQNKEKAFLQNNLCISLVSDIRNFTALCETHDPEIITSLLNHHFDQMTRIIHSCDGEITRFVGDAIEAVFPCSSTNVAEVAEKAIQASIMMLETVRIINDERTRQNLFNYKIGIGLASGSFNAFSAGQQNSRQEVLRIGPSQNLAAQLEGLSKNFPQCPLLIDQTTFNFLNGQSFFKKSLMPQKSDHVNFYVFNKLPEIPDFNFSTAAEQDLPSGHKAFKNFCENFKHAKPSFLQGLIILAAPFLIVIMAIIASQQKNIDLARIKAEKINHHTINSANLKNSNREIISKQFQEFLDKHRSEICKGIRNGNNGQLSSLKSLIQQELNFYGLHARQIILLPFTRENSSTSPQQDTTEDSLNRLLYQGLKCFGSNLNRYLLPDEDSLEILNDSMNAIMFSRDARANFVQSKVASQSSWIYWQPVINDFDLWKDIFESPVSWQARLYGIPSEVEENRFVAGGILVVCDAPSDPSALRMRNNEKLACYARINVKNENIEEMSGNFNALPGFEGFASLNASESAAFLLAQTHKTFSRTSDIVVEHGLSGGSVPEIRIAITSIYENILLIKNRSRTLIILAIGIFLLTALIWFLTHKEKFLAKRVIWQIIGGFTGTVMIPLAGIIFTLSLLHGDLKTNLIEQSREAFLKDVDQIEQKLTFHQYRNPLRMMKYIKRTLDPNISRTDISQKNTPELFQKAQKKLRVYLNRIFQHHFIETRALGLNSMMIDIPNGLSESLQVFGTLATPEDPMRITFSHHARRVLSRLNPEIQDRFINKPDQTKEILNEMVSQQVFEILASTYGEGASLEILFGQGNPVVLFGGYASDVFYQELYPSKDNPSGLIFVAFSDFHSNFFAVSRILTVFPKLMDFSGGFHREIFAINRAIPGMPAFPASGEKYPFLRQTARNFILSGKTEDRFIHDGKDFQVFVFQSKKVPQFIFSSVIDVQAIDQLINNRLMSLSLVVLIVFLILAFLSLKISREITDPLKILTESMYRVKNGNYSFSLTFDREDELEKIALAFNDMQKLLGEKNLLAGMVSESAAKMASSDELERLAISGVRRKAVILYFGINDFTRLVTDSTVEKAMETLKQWVSDISTSVIAAGGEVDKILEGRILAVFFTDRESPLNSHDQSSDILQLACQTAIDICDNASIQTSCGIHAGNVISGLMGNEKRRDYTIIGDTVNVAARCFSVSEQASEKASVICTNSTRSMLSDEFSAVDLGSFILKGKKEPLHLFRLTH